MTVATQLSMCHFSIVEELVEKQKPADGAFLDADFEAMGQEFIRSWRQFQRNYEDYKDDLFAGKVRDINAVGGGLLQAADVGLRAAQAMSDMLDARAKGTFFNWEGEFRKAKDELIALRSKILENWPFIKTTDLDRSRQEFSQGKFRTCGEPLHGTQGARA